MNLIEIIVEIGTEEQKVLIVNELSILENAIKGLTTPLKTPVYKLVVPEEFDSTVNQIEGRADYTSQREHFTLAKNAIDKDGISLIFSKLLYTDDHDFQTRFQTYAHELFHVVNRENYAKCSVDSVTTKQHHWNLQSLFDEYHVNRKSFELCDTLLPAKTERFNNHITTTAEGFAKIVSNPKHHSDLKQAITTFRSNRDIDVYLDKSCSIFRSVSMAISYTYAYLDHFDSLMDIKAMLETSKFINSKTAKLIDYFRLKYSDGDFDLSGGYKLMEDFMDNFGIHVVDKPEGRQYCYVVDVG